MDSRDDEQTELLRNIWNQIKELDRNLGGRIDRTNQEVAGVKQEVVDLRVELGGRIDGVKQEVVDLRVELGGRIDGVKQEVAGVKQEVAGVKQEVAELRGDVQDLEIEVKAVRIASQSTFELLARADTRQRNDIDELRDRLERVERHVGLQRPG